MLAFFFPFLLAASPLLQGAELQVRKGESGTFSTLDDVSKEFKKGPRGPAGPQGPMGPRGPRGAPGISAAVETVYFSTTVSVAPTYNFAFFSNASSGTAPEFDASSTNPFPSVYSSTFLVPFDGTISDLTIRLDFRSLEIVASSFDFVVYSSGSTIGTSGPIASWTATELAQSTGLLNVDSGSSLTATFQNVEDTVSVTAGTLLTVVISPSGYNMFDIQPATFSASFKYLPGGDEE